MAAPGYVLSTSIPSAVPHVPAMCAAGSIPIASPCALPRMFVRCVCTCYEWFPNPSPTSIRPQVMAGRQAIVAEGGLAVLTEALATTPEDAAGALRVRGGWG